MCFIQISQNQPLLSIMCLYYGNSGLIWKNTFWGEKNYEKADKSFHFISYLACCFYPPAHPCPQPPCRLNSGRRAATTPIPSISSHLIFSNLPERQTPIKPSRNGKTGCPSGMALNLTSSGIIMRYRKAVLPLRVKHTT